MSSDAGPEPYTPKRDHRFYYIHDAIHFIEKRQCTGCVHAEPTAPEEPGGSCPVLVQMYLEEPCVGVLGEGPDVIDLGDDGIRCTRESRSTHAPAL